jgi:hypothetical protein
VFQEANKLPPIAAVLLNFLVIGPPFDGATANVKAARFLTFPCSYKKAESASEMPYHHERILRATEMTPDLEEIGSVCNFR